MCRQIERDTAYPSALKHGCAAHAPSKAYASNAVRANAIDLLLNEFEIMVIAKTAITSGVDSELKEPKQSRKNNKVQQ